MQNLLKKSIFIKYDLNYDIILLTKIIFITKIKKNPSSYKKINK